MDPESDTRPSQPLDLERLKDLDDTGNPPRLNMPAGGRVVLSSSSAFIAGMALGAYHGTTKTAFQFRAENAHRFPTTSAGWYQYHKSKNYKAVVGGVKDGVKMGAKLFAGSLAFCLIEETVDKARNRRDFLSTVTAGLSFSGVYSLIGTVDDTQYKPILHYVTNEISMQPDMTYLPQQGRRN